MDNKALIENIIRACEKKGEKPTPACRNAGVGYNFVTDLKNGSSPSVVKLQKLADYLGTTTSALLGEKIPPVSELDTSGNFAPAGRSEKIKATMELLAKLNPENLEKAQDHLDYLLARQAEEERKS